MNDRPTLNDLLATWQAWSMDNALARAPGRTREEIEALRGDPGQRVDPLTALAAQHEVATLLSGWEWHTVRAAREAGATWAEIGEATRQSPESALDCYLGTVSRQAAAARRGWLPGGFDPAPYYAAAGRWIDELRGGATVEVVEEIEDAIEREDIEALDSLRARWWDPNRPLNPAEIDRAASARPVLARRAT